MKAREEDHWASCGSGHVRLQLAPKNLTAHCRPPTHRQTLCHSGLPDVNNKNGLKQRYTERTPLEGCEASLRTS